MRKQMISTDQTHTLITAL